jgi:hypothetical protein
MEEWYSGVRKWMDQFEERQEVKSFCDRIFQDLHFMKIKDKGKFKQRMGPEFELWAKGLEEDYPPELVVEILNDDPFWLLTLKVARGRKI